MPHSIYNLDAIGRSYEFLNNLIAEMRFFSSKIKIYM